MSFRGAPTPEPPPGTLPLDLTKGPKAGPWTPPVLGYARTLFPFRYSWEMEMRPHSQHPAHPTAPMQLKPSIHVQWGGGK